MSDEDKLFEEAIKKIRNAIRQSIPFTEALNLTGITDPGLKAAVADDALKVLIAEMHFNGEQMAVEELSRKLKLPVGTVKQARSEMLSDVEADAIEAYKSSIGQTGNA